MQTQRGLTRRAVLKSATLAAIAAAGARRIGHAGETRSEATLQVPLKIGIRAASLRMIGQLEVIRTAASIPGIMGVELQTTAGKENLRNMDVVRRYKREADRWAIRIPSLAGVWDRGVGIRSPAAAESLTQTLRAAELLGCSVILVAFFRNDAPDMTREASYGPIVTMLQKVAKRAADAGVVLGLENSLSPADNKKLVDLVDHRAVGVYYDLHNMAYYGHANEAIPGIRLLGKKRICMVHVKNGSHLIEEPGPIDWAAAFAELNHIGYDGWYVYETAHESTADCIEDTKKNNSFLRKHVRMPLLPAPDGKQAGSASGQ